MYVYIRYDYAQTLAILKSALVNLYSSLIISVHGGGVTYLFAGPVMKPLDPSLSAPKLPVKSITSINCLAYDPLAHVARTLLLISLESSSLTEATLTTARFASRVSIRPSSPLQAPCRGPCSRMYPFQGALSWCRTGVVLVLYRFV